ncbi:rRNA small subunit methyltransferase I [Cynara cardunculus var. scolymus]|uniref:rRNA small subunit methyltransferase I n=1 Tax=Cynara cardunculus var. scolymus TaxID=59895 RepID=A0A103XWZ9_CYNCS|nr:rRNA small subunit methyltransferase I [Cynara cardunculus var. scolymus]
MLRMTISRFPPVSPASWWSITYQNPSMAAVKLVPPSTLYYPRRFALFICSDSQATSNVDSTHLSLESSSKQGTLKSGLYLVGTPIGNLEDITLRALRVLRSADVILAEDTRHSGKLLHHYSIKTPLLSYHKFNEAQREQSILKRLIDGEIVALISDAGTPGISDPGSELANISVIPIPGPCAFVAALSASGLSTIEFTFVGFLPKNASARRERLMVSANEAATQIFYFWRGTLGEAKAAFLDRQPKGEITFLIEGKAISEVETPSEAQLENELADLIFNGHTLSTAVKLVAAGTSMKRKTIYSLALRKFGRQHDARDDVD